MKIMVISKKTSTVLAVCLCAVLLVGVITAPAAISAATTERLLPIYCVQTEEKIASLSFDAAWGNEDTQQLIDILEQYNVKATFFVVGDWVRKYPESVKALHDAGHEVMNHSNTHEHMPDLTAEEIKADVEACNQEIEAITGVCPTLFRPPYGDYDNHSIQAILEEGMYPIQWDVDSLDWKDLSASEICTRVTEKVQNGSIVLFHNAALNTPSALPEIIEKLQNDGYSLVPVSELIYTGQYSIDHTGRQCPEQA